MDTLYHGLAERRPSLLRIVDTSRASEVCATPVTKAPLAETPRSILLLCSCGEFIFRIEKGRRADKA